MKTPKSEIVLQARKTTSHEYDHWHFELIKLSYWNYAGKIVQSDQYLLTVRIQMGGDDGPKSFYHSYAPKLQDVNIDGCLTDVRKLLSRMGDGFPFSRPARKLAKFLKQFKRYEYHNHQYVPREWMKDPETWIRAMSQGYTISK